MVDLGRFLCAGEKHSQRSARATPQGEKPPMNTAQDKFFRARITQRADFSEDLWMIRVDPGGEFHFIAGQYPTLGVQTPLKLSERPYSIVSSPYAKDGEFFLELVPHGELT